LQCSADPDAVEPNLLLLPLRWMIGALTETFAGAL
jgi:hypothetical protein